jgi:hypothetical protein
MYQRNAPLERASGHLFYGFYAGQNQHYRAKPARHTALARKSAKAQP